MDKFKKYKAFINSKRDSELADGIKDVYLNNLDEMDYMKKQHFLSRLSKCYKGNWRSKIRESAKILADELLDNYEKNKIGKFDSIKSFLKARNANNSDVEAKKKGNAWVSDNKAEIGNFLSYLDILMKCNILHRLKCEDLLGDQLNEIKTWLMKEWDSQIDWVIQNPKCFIHIPVQSVNIFYYMSSFKIMDPNVIDEAEIKFLDSLRKSYEGILEDPISFNNYLYALTHVIIGESWFYEYKLPLYKEKYDWIIKFFKTNYERIIESSVEDIVIEIGVVMLICNEISEAEKYKKYARKRIGSNGYIEPIDKSKGLSESEHTNILAIMLLKGF